MYANHIDSNSTVEVHMTRREYADLPLRARLALCKTGTHVGYDPGPQRGPIAVMVWHLAHTDALHIENLIDEYS